MSICEICGEEEDTLYKCKQCGKLFCEYCGSIDNKMCVDCLDEFIDEDDWYKERVLEDEE